MRFPGSTHDVEPATRTVEERPPRLRSRRHSTAWLWAMAAGAAIAALVAANRDDPRTLGTQIDAAINGVRNAGTQAGQTLAASQDAAVEASRSAIDGVGAAIDDTGISAKVKAALAVDPALSASRITVTTERGIVRLEGPAPDPEAKERATVLAAAPAGVRGVDNRLALPQPGQVVATPAAGASVQPVVLAVNGAAPAPAAAASVPVFDDAAVTAAVKAALAGDAALSATRIEVNTSVGVVRMEGVVPDAAARERATQLAAGQRGVRAVDNRLVLPDAVQVAQGERNPTETAPR
jgi:osmotically-inducible protein OsmY